MKFTVTMHDSLSSRIRSYIGALFGGQGNPAGAAGAVVLNRYFTGDPKAHPALSLVIHSMALEAANQNAQTAGTSRPARGLIGLKLRRTEPLD